MTLSDMAIRHSVSRSLPVRRRIKSVCASAEAYLKSIHVHLCSHRESTASNYIGFNSFANSCLRIIHGLVTMNFLTITIDSSTRNVQTNAKFSPGVIKFARSRAPAP